MTPNDSETRRARKVFSSLLSASVEELRHRITTELCFGEVSLGRRIGAAASRLGLRKAQLVCALGFNPGVQGLAGELAALGYPSFEELARHRNHVFATDVYAELSVDEVQSIYRTAHQDPHCRAIMQYLVPQRLAQIESEIDATVNPNLIDRYQREVRYFYRNGIAQAEFVETRLSQGSPGFRALSDELTLLIEAKLLTGAALIEHPALVPSEKRRLIERGLALPVPGIGMALDRPASEARHPVLDTSILLDGH